MTKPIDPITPSQIGSITGIDRMDSLDRQKLSPEIKLELLANEYLAKHGYMGAENVSFVGRPRVVLQLLLDAGVQNSFHSYLCLHKAIVIGEKGADIVATWRGIPIIVRCTVADDQLHACREDQIPPSKGIDRKQASRIRMAAHSGQLASLRDE